MEKRDESRESPGKVQGKSRESLWRVVVFVNVVPIEMISKID